MYYSTFCKLVFIVFVFIMHIVLFNMLIALMGNTYNQVSRQSYKEYYKKRAENILAIEKSFTPKQLQTFQDKYSIRLANRGNECGFMVIKQVDKTNAFKRRANISNWKVSLCVNFTLQFYGNYMFIK